MAGSRSSPERAPPVVAGGGPLDLVRADPLEEQGRPTWDLAAEAFREGRREDGVTLARYALTEAREAYELYREWIVALPDVTVALGADRESTGSAGEKIGARTGVAGPADADSLWSAFEEAVEAVARLGVEADPDQAIAALAAARSTWLEGHDRIHDQICAWFDLAASELGESRIGELWDALLGHLYAGRGRLLETAGGSRDPVANLVLDVAAALRGHLSGPGRRGSVEIAEETDRWRVTIPFCGSGGRTYQTDDADAAAVGEQRPKAGMTTEPHPWAWESEGVCLYCVHCCQLQQRAPIELLGRPLRVVEPPRWPRDRDQPRCTWYVYKDEEKIPASAWEAVGATPPASRH